MNLSYVLPIRRPCPADGELRSYLEELAEHAEVIVVDGSPADVFDAHDEAWAGFVTHVRPSVQTVNGKVAGVLTGLAHARHEHVVIADDDVRYDASELRSMAELLEAADVVRPQNFFDPLPWHARWDTARSLVNRATGGDWPGTLGVRRSAVAAAGGYDGGVLFENLELVRTVAAAGGTERVAWDLFVRRLPPSAAEFLGQRVRQAYDELARPGRLAVQLSLLPAALLLVARRRLGPLAAAAVAAVAVAEAGRRRAGARSVFPASCSLLAPLWVAERALCSWLALASRILLGGAPYRGGIVRSAATPLARLRRRLRNGAGRAPSPFPSDRLLATTAEAR